MGRPIKRFSIYVLVRAAAFILLFIPIRLAVFLGGFLGFLLFYLIKGERERAIENLSQAFKSEKTAPEIYYIAKKVFFNIGKSAAEFISFPKINKHNIDRFVKAAGLEKLDRALQDKKGVIMLSCHLGNWELSAAYFGLKGYCLSAIARPLRYEKFDKLVNSYRISKGVRIIHRDNSFKKILLLLKANEIVGILPDQDIDAIDGVFVKFFGRDAYTPKGPVVLAMVSGAPILPVFCIRKNGAHNLIVEDPIKLQISGDREKDIIVNTQKWTDIIEKYIREYPEQWVWMHRRWKTQPA